MRSYLSVSGTIDGVNAVFTLSAVVSSLQLFKNGQLQNPGGDYTWTGGTAVTFVPGSIPAPGDTLLALGE